MEFDITICKKFDDNINIDYGIVNGNNTILFIKAGQDGSMYGYENKYLQIAKRINEKYGYTVIASSNPFDGRNPLDNAIEVIEEYCKNKFDDYDIYLWDILMVELLVLGLEITMKRLKECF